jgi:UDP-N-acetylmuramoylalanine--D-glutamate ligase
MMSFPPDHFAGKRVTVMGLGRFGGQIAAIKYLVHQGAIVTVTDVIPEERLKPSLKAIEGLDVNLHLGGHLESDFIDTDLIVVSPAVSKESRYLKLAAQNQVPFTSEMNLFLDRCRAKVMAVTGTVGKSTTLAMIESILRLAESTDFPRLGYRKSWCGGNIGKSLLENLVHIQADDIVVLELSSFQLEDLAGIEYSPHVAMVTNVHPNHLDRHKTLENYIDAKANITRFQQSGDVLITCADDSKLDRIRDICSGNVIQWQFGQTENDQLKVRISKFDKGLVLECRLGDTGQWEKIVSGNELCVPGEHNLSNAAGAAAVCLAVGIGPETIAEGLRRFAGLSDRLELVGESKGVRWFNDSKSTTPESGMVALKSFEAGTVLAIAGGYDKESDLSEFALELAHRSKMTYCLGATAPKLTQAIEHAGGQTCKVDSLEQAVLMASAMAEAGNVVLLSPGCASWDMFENYQERGRRFTEAVRKIIGGHQELEACK